jgi:DNA-binding response OmpR family regulator
VVAVGGLTLPEAAWPLRVLMVESPSLPAGSVQVRVHARDLEVWSVPDVYAALLALGDDTPAAVVLPTDLVGADPAQVTASILARHDLSVLVALAPEEGAADIAGRAVEAGCAGLVPIPLEESHLCAAVSRAARLERGGPGDRLLVGGVVIDLAGLTVTGEDGTRVQLSGMQFTCLYLLARAWPQPVRLDQLATQLGLAGDHGDERARRLVARLRHHIAPAAGGRDLVENVRGVGYRLRG